MNTSSVQTKHLRALADRTSKVVLHTTRTLLHYHYMYTASLPLQALISAFHLRIAGRSRYAFASTLKTVLMLMKDIQQQVGIQTIHCAPIRLSKIFDAKLRTA